MTGPTFLQGPKNEWPASPNLCNIWGEDEEVRQNFLSLKTSVLLPNTSRTESSKTSIDILLESNNDWYKILRKMSYILKFIDFILT